MEAVQEQPKATEEIAPQTPRMTNGSEVAPSLRSALKATIKEMIEHWREHLRPEDWAKVCPYDPSRLPGITYNPNDVNDKGFQKMVQRELVQMAGAFRTALHDLEQRDKLVKDLIEYLRNFKDKVIICTSEVAVPDKSGWRNSKATVLLGGKGFFIQVKGECHNEESGKWKDYYFNRICLWTKDLVQFVWNGTNTDDIRRILESAWNDIYFERKHETPATQNKQT